ncbi:helix-turn-helix transcriptional regulator [Streptomyces lydicus]|uniref:Translation initiation factor IF-2 n=1 Tax=Streptomyces lydicus TaxID=47763 RepID=A0A1D7VN71_9ACTN|nr:helix-turn-helix transcriptional regulator [Streptomyces lydicus]AOP48197.1 translation initiation factor IF-2 [Streptomyces lydicus]
MGKSGHPDVRDLAYTATAGAAAGVELVELGGLFERARRHGNDPYAPLRPAFHQLLTVRGRPMRMSVDFVEHELPDGAWLWIRPGQVQQFGPELVGADGTIVVFQPGFLPPSTVAVAHMDPPYMQRPLRPDGAAADGLRRALDHLVFEYAALASLPLESYVEVMRHLVSVLVLRLASAQEGEHPRSAAGAEAFRRFHEAVERDHAVTRRVEDYAAALGYSQRTLSRATLAAVGTTAKKYIDERVLLEAKRLLQHSRLPAKAVADRLGFADASDFNKFFRRRAGTTPAAFRAQARGRRAASPPPGDAT